MNQRSGNEDVLIETIFFGLIGIRIIWEKLHLEGSIFFFHHG